MNSTEKGKTNSIYIYLGVQIIKIYLTNLPNNIKVSKNKKWDDTKFIVTKKRNCLERFGHRPSPHDFN